MAFATIKDVARRAGVSVPTVSQVLNDTGRISVETRQKVLDTIHVLNYIPNSAARSIRSSSTKTVGVLVPDIRNSYFAYLVAAITKELSKNGYVCLIGSSSESLDGQDKFLRSLLSQRIDGAIIVPQGKVSPGLKKFLEADLPLVFLDRSVNGIGQHNRVPLIDADPYPGMEAAMRSVISSGHRILGFVHGPTEKSSNLRERQDVFSMIGVQSLGESHILVADSSSPTNAIKELLTKGVDTFFFGYSPDALTAIRYFHDKGLEIGKDISMVSFDEIPFFELTSPAISIISQQLTTMGTSGARTLLSMLKHIGATDPRKTISDIRIPTEFISRGSVSSHR